MSSVSSGPDSGGGNSQDFDLNIAPIIDCFTVLIAFMLVSATFLSIGILDAGVSASGAQSQDSTTVPQIAVAVELQKNHSIIVRITGKETSNKTFGAIDGEKWNTKDLDGFLNSLKAKYKDFNAMTLSAQDQIAYDDLIQIMESTKKTIPAILLGGF